MRSRTSRETGRMPGDRSGVSSPVKDSSFLFPRCRCFFRSPLLTLMAASVDDRGSFKPSPDTVSEVDYRGLNPLNRACILAYPDNTKCRRRHTSSPFNALVSFGSSNVSEHIRFHTRISKPADFRGRGRHWRWTSPSTVPFFLWRR